MKLFTTIKNAKRLLYILAIITLPLNMYAQVGPPEDDVEDVPLDGGISLLLAGGIAYGAKRINDRKEKKNNNPFRLNSEE